MLDVYVPNLLRMKRFHEALAGTVHECSLTSHIGRVSQFFDAFSLSFKTAFALIGFQGRGM
jgi:hypothetical protein